MKLTIIKRAMTSFLDEKHIEKLKELGLYELYINDILTISEFVSHVKIPFNDIKKTLKTLGYAGPIDYGTKLDPLLIPIVLRIRPIKKKSKVKKKIIKKVGNTTRKPKNKVLLRIWLKRDQELKDAEKNPRAILINIPMGGKVK